MPSKQKWINVSLWWIYKLGESCWNRGSRSWRRLQRDICGLPCESRKKGVVQVWFCKGALTHTRTLIHFSYFWMDCKNSSNAVLCSTAERPKQLNLVRQKSVHFVTLSPSAAAIKLPKLNCHKIMKIQPLSPYGFKCCYQDSWCRGKNKTFYC